MLGKCTRKLLFRWCLVYMLVSMTVMAIAAFFTPLTWAATTVRLHSGLVYTLPFALPRIFDPLVALVPFTLLVWSYLDLGFIEDRWGKRSKSNDRMGHFEVNAGIGTGMVLGALGCVIIPWAGFAGVAIGTSIVAGIVGVCSANAVIEVSKTPKPNVRQYFVIETAAVVTIWMIMTLIAGIVPGLLYALAALAVAAAAHFGMYALVMAVNASRQPIRKFFTECGYENHA